MTTQEIYNLSEELTEQQVNNVLAGWERDGDIKEIKTFNTLVRLGDSRALACASTIAKKINKKDNDEFYYNAYCI